MCHSPPSRTEVRNAWIYISTPCTLLVWCLFLHRDCTFTLPSIRIKKNGFSWLHKAHPSETTTASFNSHFLRGVRSFGRGGKYRHGVLLASSGKVWSLPYGRGGKTWRCLGPDLYNKFLPIGFGVGFLNCSSDALVVLIRYILLESVC